VIGERPTGPELVDALRAAAAKAGVPLKRFVEPIATSSADNLIGQLGRAVKPVQATIDRVCALIAGEPIPPPRESPFKGHFGKRECNPAPEARVPAWEIERRRALTDQARVARRPGETLAAAVKRLANG
jgi:hypothetical protein